MSRGDGCRVPGDAAPAGSSRRAYLSGGRAPGRAAADHPGRQAWGCRGPFAVDGRAIWINPGAAARMAVLARRAHPRHTPNRPGNHAPPAAGRTNRSVVSKQAYPAADSHSKVRRRLPAPPATILRPNQRLTARQRPAHAGTSVHVPAHGDQRCPSLIAAWPHPTLASPRSGPPARPDQELPPAGPA
jgi:hypothetical protein